MSKSGARNVKTSNSTVVEVKSESSVTITEKSEEKIIESKVESEKKKAKKSTSFSKFDKLQKKQQETPTICKSCAKQVFLVELIKAEKAAWHKSCFKCSECGKSLNVDTYVSHEGNLYCKPHHRSLFAPKVVDEEEEDVVKKPSSYVLENEPEALPEGVVRASDALDTGLEEIQLTDVRSKFELFENFDKNKEENREIQKATVKKSPSILLRQSQLSSEAKSKGVSNEELGQFNESDDDQEVKNPLAAMREVLQAKEVEKVRKMWEETNGVRSLEEMKEERKGEMLKFRSRLCQGKSSNLRALYENGEISENSPKICKVEEDIHADTNKLKEIFENGKRNSEDLQKTGGVDLEVFENGTTKESWKVFREMESKQGERVEEPKPTPRKILKNSFIVENKEEEVEKTDKIEIKSEDVKSKFRFFEELKDNKPTETTEELDDPRDHLILSKSKTASKMLSVFKQLEENKKEYANNNARKFKEFTPEREPRRILPTSSDSDRSATESEEEVEETEENYKKPEEDAFLKEVGSLARARSLRAKFERWESSENQKNKPVELDETSSIESARILRERFEKLKEEEERRLEEQKEKKKFQVRRFK